MYPVTPSFISTLKYWVLVAVLFTTPANDPVIEILELALVGVIEALSPILCQFPVKLSVQVLMDENTVCNNLPPPPWISEQPKTKTKF